VYVQGKNIELISGVELSATRSDEDIHILGYLFRSDDARLLEMLEKFRRIRLERGKKMTERLAEIGMVVDFDEVLKAAGHAPVGRPHVAEAMVKSGLVSSYNEAFEKYLFTGGPVYVPKAKLTPTEAIDLIHGAGGVAVMAHPGLIGRDEIIEELVRCGLDGLEIFHPVHNAADRKRYRKTAERFGLFLSGGSDSHNRKGRYGDIGEEKVPFDYLAEIKTRHRRYA